MRVFNGKHFHDGPAVPNAVPQRKIIMSSYRRNFATIFAGHTDAPYDPEHREFVENIASALYERYEDLPPIEQWPKSVRYFYACYDLNFQVGNGGFAQAAYNVPELIPMAKEAFDHFGCQHAAELCRKAVSLLPAELVEHLEKGLTDTDSLQDVFDHFNESAMAELDETIPDEFWVDDKLQELVQKNRADFESIDNLT